MCNLSALALVEHAKGGGHVLLARLHRRHAADNKVVVLLFLSRLLWEVALTLGPTHVASDNGDNKPRKTGDRT